MSENDGRRRPASGLTAAIETDVGHSVTSTERAVPDLGGLAANLKQQSFEPGLYIVATPIGNLADLSLRAASVMLNADAVYCEDTRMTGRLLDAIGCRRTLLTYHEHNAELRRDEIIGRLLDGQRVALVSDAGTPLISDPGYKLVRAVRDAGIAIRAVPGPSALTAALSISGLPTDTFLFCGFLPTKRIARQKRLRELGEVRATLVLYESPQRVRDCLSDALVELGDRKAALTRELTKTYEEVSSGHLSELIEWVGDRRVRGEICLVIAPPDDRTTTVEDGDIEVRLRQVLTEFRVKEAAQVVANEFGVSRQRVYRLAIELKDRSSNTDSSAS